MSEYVLYIAFCFLLLVFASISAVAGFIFANAYIPQFRLSIVLLTPGVILILGEVFYRIAFWQITGRFYTTGRAGHSTLMIAVCTLAGGTVAFIVNWKTTFGQW